MNDTGAKPAVLHQRVGWLELFYHLVFVVVIVRLTHLVHGDPSWSLIWTSIGLTFVVWLAWSNVSAMTNVSGVVGPRGRPLLFLSMAGMGVLAIGVEGVTEGHFWLFVIGYAIARAATWPLWLRGRIERPNHLTRALPFAPVLLATLAVGFVHQVWLLVVALVVLATAEIGFSFAGRGDVEGRRLHGPHMVERIGLLLMLLLGECVVQIVNALDEDHREPMHWVTAACAMALSCALWWLVYDATVPRSRPRWIATTPRSPTSSAAPSSASPPGSSSWRPAWPTPSTRRRPRKARRTCTPDRSPACAPRVPRARGRRLGLR